LRKIPDIDEMWSAWSEHAEKLSELPELKYCGEAYHATIYNLIGTPYALRLCGDEIIWYINIGYGRDANLPLLDEVSFSEVFESPELNDKHRDFLVFNLDILK
jgi:hypothetical protein